MRCFIVALLAVSAGCGAPSNVNHLDASTGPTDDGGAPIGDAGESDGSATDGGGIDAGPIGAAITCPGPGMPRPDNGACGSERWNIKTGTDSQASSVSLVPKLSTIAALDALPAAGGGTVRDVPTEHTVWELTNVTLTEIKLETDNDYHLVVSDGTHTLIAEVPSPHCSPSSVWACFMSRVRSEVDAKYVLTSSPLYPAAIITIRGLGFFDFLHGQNGVAPNAIEIHPILQICFGKNCVPS